MSRLTINISMERHKAPYGMCCLIRRRLCIIHPHGMSFCS